jgi:hypothetical protein
VRRLHIHRSDSPGGPASCRCAARREVPSSASLPRDHEIDRLGQGFRPDLRPGRGGRGFATRRSSLAKREAELQRQLAGLSECLAKGTEEDWAAYAKLRVAVRLGSRLVQAVVVCTALVERLGRSVLMSSREQHEEAACRCEALVLLPPQEGLEWFRA